MLSSVPKLWPDSTVYIIGGGPSVNKTNLSLIHNKYVIGCNNAYTLGNWVDVLFFGDCKWYFWHTVKYRKIFNRYNNLIISCCTETIDDPDIITLKRVRPSKMANCFCTNNKKVAWMGNTGATAMNVAYHLGAIKIILIGFDMKLIENKINYHDDHIIKENIKKMEKELFPKFINSFQKWVKKGAENLNIEILNATPGSALTIFPIVNLEDVV